MGEFEAMLFVIASILLVIIIFIGLASRPRRFLSHYMLSGGAVGASLVTTLELLMPK